MKARVRDRQTNTQRKRETNIHSEERLKGSENL